MNNDKGFTLVEVVVVVVILSILATILIPSMTGFLTKSNDEKNAEDAQTILDSSQAEFYALYAINGHDNKSKPESIVAGENNWNPGHNKRTLDVDSDDEVNVYISDIHNKVHYPITTKILSNVGYKIHYESNGEWKSDIPCAVMVITGDYMTYCDPTKETYNPEKAYTVYGVFFNKNVGGDFFVLLKNGKKKYPKTKKELDEIINAIEDENEEDPDNHLVKQIYVLKAGHPDNKNNAGTWDYYHTINPNDKYAVNYSANKNKKSDD